MDLGLTGCSAIVLGASQGMGLAVAEALSAEGTRVAMFARSAETLEREATRIGALAVPGDITRPADLEHLVAATVAAFGGIDVLVLNGGGPPPGLAAELTSESVAEAVALLFQPHVLLVGLCLPHLRASGRGRIVAIASSSIREPIPGLALSNAVRPGVLGWLKTLAREVAAEGVTVNTIAPGWILTERLRSLFGDNGPSAEALERVPARRTGTPAEVGAAACFLASEQAAYVNGAVLPVDGGMLHGLT